MQRSLLTDLRFPAQQAVRSPFSLLGVGHRTISDRGAGGEKGPGMFSEMSWKLIGNFPGSLCGNCSRNFRDISCSCPDIVSREFPMTFPWNSCGRFPDMFRNVLGKFWDKSWKIPGCPGNYLDVHAHFPELVSNGPEEKGPPNSGNRFPQDNQKRACCTKSRFIYPGFSGPVWTCTVYFPSKWKRKLYTGWRRLHDSPDKKKIDDVF